MKRKDPNVYPPGLNAKKVAAIIRYYDARQDMDLLEDPNHVLIHQATSWVEVPQNLLPRVRKLIAEYKKSA
jgi:hypothetical protein